MESPYDKIIHLPHHVSTTRPPMSRQNRAAQFAPFAALTGYDAAVRETARQTVQRLELSEDRKQELDEQLQTILQHIEEQPAVSVTYFEPDQHKDGGQYRTVSGRVQKINLYRRVLFLDCAAIPLDEVYGYEPHL